MAQGQNSLLFPPYLLPKSLSDVPRVAVSIGSFLKPLPTEPPQPVVDLKKRARGRPRKGQERAATNVAGRFGGQDGRRVEEQIKLLQSDWKVPCVPKASFVRNVKDLLKQPAVAHAVQALPVQGQPEPEQKTKEPEQKTEEPDWKISKAALQVLQEAVEEHGFPNHFSVSLDYRNSFTKLKPIHTNAFLTIEKMHSRKVETGLFVRATAMISTLSRRGQRRTIFGQVQCVGFARQAQHSFGKGRERPSQIGELPPRLSDGRTRGPKPWSEAQS